MLVASIYDTANNNAAEVAEAVEVAAAAAVAVVVPVVAWTVRIVECSPLDTNGEYDEDVADEDDSSRRSLRGTTLTLPA